MKKLIVTTIACVGIMMGSQADFSQFADASGYVTTFTIGADGASAGAWQFGSDWAVGYLRADAGASAGDWTIYPNQNTYNASDAYWANGDDGNKWLVSTLKYEMAGSNALSAQQTSASMTFDVNSYTLDSRYTVTAFVKTLDPNAGYSVSANDSVVLSDGLGETTLSLDTSALAGHILQVGFETQGINANPATDWGNADVSISDINVIPEPATMGLLGIFGGALAMARRRFSV